MELREKCKWEKREVGVIEREREIERDASALVIHLFCVCACLCGSVGGYRCQAARFFAYIHLQQQCQ